MLKHRYFANDEFLESSLGVRPSYAWRSILHGRELMKQGLISAVGDGANTKVWVDNWIFDSIPRPPRYRQEAMVDLTLTVEELIEVQTGRWNVERIHQLIHAEDVDLVLRTPVS